MNRLVYWILFDIFLPVIVLGFTWCLLATYFHNGQAIASIDLLRLMQGVKGEVEE